MTKAEIVSFTFSYGEDSLNLHPNFGQKAVMKINN